MTTLSTPDQIATARLLTLRAMLVLECKGMKRSKAPSAYSILKRDYGLTGTRESVLKQLDAMRAELLGESK
jgi:hypothetical protein